MRIGWRDCGGQGGQGGQGDLGGWRKVWEFWSRFDLIIFMHCLFTVIVRVIFILSLFSEYYLNYNGDKEFTINKGFKMEEGYYFNKLEDTCNVKVYFCLNLILTLILNVI